MGLSGSFIGPLIGDVCVSELLNALLVSVITLN